MSARNIHLLEELVGVLITQGKTRSNNGMTIKDMAILMNVSDETIRKAVKKYEGFKLCVFPSWPDHYYWDRSSALTQIRKSSPKTRSNTGSAAEKFHTYVGVFPRLTLEGYSPSKFTLMLNSLQRTQGTIVARITEGFVSLAAAHRESVDFQRNGRLETSEWEEKVKAIVTLRNNLTIVAEFLDAVLEDERINTPEFWAVFTDTIDTN